MSQERIGRYEIQETLGRGGMGTVFLVFDPLLEVRRALKVMNAGEVDEKLYERFLLEARSAARLRHPNIVAVYDMVQDRKKPYIVMEYVEGQDLKSLIERQEYVPIGRKLSIIRTICEALSYAHERKVVHRDIKPANIRVQSNGAVKILDFGLARLESIDLTQTGMPIGSPYYMSPEQVRGERSLDGRSDLFSLGVVLYEWLTYCRPFEAENPSGVYLAIVSQPHKPLQEALPGCPSELGAIVDRLLAKDRQQRYSNCQALADDLKAFEQLIPSKQTELADEVARLETEFSNCRDEAVRHRMTDWFETELFKDETLLHGVPKPSFLVATGGNKEEDYFYLLQRRNSLSQRLEKLGIEFRRILPVIELFDSARRQLESGDLETCWVNIQKVLLEAPSNPRVQRLHEECKARAELKRSQEERQQRVANALTRASEALDAGNVAGCLQFVGQALTLDPGNAEADRLKREAQEKLDRARRVKAILAQAKGLWNSGELSSCLSLLAQGLELDPTQPELLQLYQAASQRREKERRIEELLERVRAGIRDRDFAFALQLLEEASEIKADDATVQAVRRDCLKALDEHTQFEELASAARGYFEAGEFQGCLEAATQALRLVPGHPEMSSLRESCQRKLDEQASVARDQKQLIQNFLIQAQGQLDSGDYEGSIQTSEEGLQLNPRHSGLRKINNDALKAAQTSRSVNLLLKRAAELLKRKEYASVLGLTAQLLELVPNSQEGQVLKSAALEGIEQRRTLDALFSQAMSLQAAGDEEAAYRISEKAIELDASFPGLQQFHRHLSQTIQLKEATKEVVEKGRALLANGDFAGALDQASEALKFDSRNGAALDLQRQATKAFDAEANIKALLSLAQETFQAGKYDESLKAASQGLEIRPSHPQLKEIWQHSTVAIQKRNKIMMLAEDARRWFREADYDKALEACGQLLEMEPHHSDGLEIRNEATASQRRDREITESVLQAKEVFEKHEYEACLQLAGRGLALDPRNAVLKDLCDRATLALEVPVRIGILLEESKRLFQVRDYQGASKTAQELLAIDPENSQAIEMARRSRELHIRSQVLDDLLAEAHEQLKAQQYEACEGTVARLVEFDSEHPQVQGLRRRVESELQKANKVRELIAIAMQLELGRKYQDCIETATKGLALAPESEELQALLLRVQNALAKRAKLANWLKSARRQIRKGQLHPALETLQRILKTEPGYPLALRMHKAIFELLASRQAVTAALATVRGYCQSGDFFRAKQEAEKGLRLDPENKSLRRTLAEVSLELERAERARELFKKAKVKWQEQEYTDVRAILTELLSVAPGHTEALELERKVAERLELEQQVEEMLAAARGFDEKGDHDECLRVASRALELQSTNAELKRLYATSLGIVRKRQKCQELLQQAQMEMQRHQFSAVIDILRRLFEVDAENEEGKRLWDSVQAIVVNHDRLEALLGAARSHHLSQDSEACYDAAAEGLALAPENEELQKLKNWAESSKQRNQKIQSLLESGKEWLDAREFAKARKAATEILALVRDCAPAVELQKRAMQGQAAQQRVRGLVSAMRQYRDDVQQSYQQIRLVVELAGEGVVHLEQEQLGEALEVGKKILAIRPRSAVAVELKRLAHTRSLARHKTGMPLRHERITSAEESFRSIVHALCQEDYEDGLKLIQESRVKRRSRYVYEAASISRQALENVNLHERICEQLTSAELFAERLDYDRCLGAAQRVLAQQPKNPHLMELFFDFASHIETKNADGGGGWSRSFFLQCRCSVQVGIARLTERLDQWKGSLCSAIAELKLLFTSNRAEAGERLAKWQGFVRQPKNRLILGGGLSVAVAILVLASTDSLRLTGEAGQQGVGTLSLDVSPWAEIDSVVNLRNQERIALDKIETPCLISLPPGHYRVSIRNPELNLWKEFPDVPISAGKLYKIDYSFPELHLPEKPLHPVQPEAASGTN